MTTRDKLAEQIKEALKKAPTIKGISVRELAKTTNTPWSTTRWHLEVLESKGIVGHVNVGRSRLYYMERRSSVGKNRNASHET